MSSPLTIKVGTSETTTCTYGSALPTSITIPVQAGGGNGGTGDDIVTYTCKLASGVSDDYPADGAEVDVRISMSPPAQATANADASIVWSGTVDASSPDGLFIPPNFPATGAKIFVSIKASGAGASPSPSGEATLGTVAEDQELTSLPTATIKVRPTTTGTISLTAGDIGFGSTTKLINCTAPTSGLKTYSVTVSASASPTNTSPTPTTTSPRPTTTRTSTVTITPSSTKKSQTPVAGADTGAGGTMGPDGRTFILTGTALVAAAAVGGLVLRRRSVKG